MLTGGEHRLIVPAPDLGPGALVGDYLVEQAHAGGGFATVYRATHIETRRIVAVKLLHLGLAGSPKLLRRFYREVELVGRLRHPNIVECLGFGEHTDGRPYLAMEWLDGATLSELVRERGRLTVRDAVRVIRELCAPLDATHAIGVVHRDLKASNVIAVPEHGWYRLTLVDFGIAKLLDPEVGDGAALTTVGVRVGSPHCMAPEQIRGEAVDARADIYALGVLFYQLLTGAPPFIGASADEVEDLHLSAAPPSPSSIVSVPASIESIVLTCLEKDPSRRFGTVTDLRAALGRASADQG